MINNNLLWTIEEYEAIVDYKANSYNKINVLLSSEVTKREAQGKYPKNKYHRQKKNSAKL